MRSSSRIVNFIVGLAGGLLTATIAIGDDIDIYAAGSDVATSRGKPNLLFIIDTSGSMREAASGGATEFAEYDPAIEYIGECSYDRIYWTISSNIADTSCRMTDQYFLYNNEFVCQAGRNALDTTGMHEDDIMLEWRLGIGSESNATEHRWRAVNSAHRDSETTTRECHADTDIHGPDETSPRKRMRTGGNHIGDQRWCDNTTCTVPGSSFQRRSFYTGNYVNWLQNYRELDRITAVKHALITNDGLLESLSDVNIGFMQFDGSRSSEGGSDGGMVVKEIVELATNKAALKEVVRNMRVRGDTPLAETYIEALRYYMGERVDFGNHTRLADPDYGWLMPAPSVSASRKATEYKEYQSPIKYECQMNHIVLLTDGLPSSDGNAYDSVKELPDWDEGTHWQRNCDAGGARDTLATSCLDDAAAYGFNVDLSSGLPGKQFVMTHTIGFDIIEAEELLRGTANKGGGRYFAVTNTASFKRAVEDIVAEVIQHQSSFTAPAVSVNAFNRTRHLDDLYFTVFAPRNTPHWDGNLKKFRIAVDDGVARIVGSDGRPAVNPDTGFFRDTAVSYWTPANESPDGGEAKLGGASSKLLINRNIFTNATDSKDLTLSENVFVTSNTNITAAALGVSEAKRDTVINFARGIDVDDLDGNGNTTSFRRARNMGDPLHSRPAVVTYGGTAEDPDMVVFFGTNDGFLHAVNTRTGIEEFAFIPKVLWPNLAKLRDNDSSEKKIYGIDTPIVARIQDNNLDGIIDQADGDYVHLYFGLRRGGRDLYALDVTKRGNPKMLWHIEGGSGEFRELGHTFAEPAPGRIRLAGKEKPIDVLFIAGGFDKSTQDDHGNVYTEDTMGRALYVIDAWTGERLWWAGAPDTSADLRLNDMRSSIAARPRAIDIDGDGLTDRVYVADMAGRVFRFDVRHGEDKLLTGGLMASLGAAAEFMRSHIHNRRFFNTPDVALVKDKQLGHYLTVALGSGERQHPNEKSTLNRFYVLKDPHVDVKLENDDYSKAYGAAYTHDWSASRLLDLTSKLIDPTSELDLATVVNSTGWFMNMPSEGEKVLAESVTIRNQLVFTTFTPTESSSSCDPGLGLGRMYAVSLNFATPLFDSTGDGVLGLDDRSQDLRLQGIPPGLTVLFPEALEGRVYGLVGTEEAPIQIQIPPQRTYWYELIDE